MAGGTSPAQMNLNSSKYNLFVASMSTMNFQWISQVVCLARSCPRVSNYTSTDVTGKATISHSHGSGSLTGKKVSSLGSHSHSSPSSHRHRLFPSFSSSYLCFQRSPKLIRTSRLIGFVAFRVNVPMATTSLLLSSNHKLASSSCTCKSDG